MSLKVTFLVLLAAIFVAGKYTNALSIRPVPKICPPVCAIHCRFGNVPDDNGCPTCQCKLGPSMCPALVRCPLNQRCPFGFDTDSNGCRTCRCKKLGACPIMNCFRFCESGYQKDANGCKTCRCNEPVDCPVTMCIHCPYGYTKSSIGCKTCQCKSKPTKPVCPSSQCLFYCFNSRRLFARIDSCSCDCRPYEKPIYRFEKPVYHLD